MDKIADIQEIIKQYCEQNENIRMAFLFGSYACGYNCKESDVDIAVYTDKEDNIDEINIQNNLEKIIRREIDLIFLRRSPAVLSWSIIRKGIPLVIKDRKKYLDFMLDVSREAEDFIDFNLDAWRKKYDAGKT